MQLAMFVAGLQQQYNKEAFSELNRQKGDPDIEALWQALIRFAAFCEKYTSIQHICICLHNQHMII
jgi:hypothetical protein